jgi:hypothetical protein
VADWFTQMAGLSYAQLGNVQALGIDLFLAVAAIQVIASAAISGLRLRTTMVAARLDNVAAAATASALQNEIIQFEREFNRVNRRLIGIVVLLMVIAVAGLAVTTIWQNRIAGVAGTLAVIGYYLALPVAILTSALARVWGPFRRIDALVRAVELSATDEG